ncbi:hypothetical protein SPRG_21146 [Saprolegnia parasitica CBS 223.65]|uniref:Uncharacterized protein n=1 Tax=Saprolegnia parasitica (strain CBS 223.65) TaxID=695850 RepID=A0A067C4C3_SAPPC|nr:hypothetical protein SPRG_21146 [Saprolegnia parasitica CBS 223.65]KDO21401.1 hypothetical protein SPRG_21146 [Saprolegnia parasitica CBS 223.65]|eukprot:XP_012207895.1 hypothetical protein SPRG_21146 [Saprolegnia parasitica CBS 223.65]
MDETAYDRGLLFGLASTSRGDVLESLNVLCSKRRLLENGMTFEDRMEAMVRLAAVLTSMANDDADVLDRARSLMVSLLIESKGAIARTVPETLDTLLGAITQRIPVQRLSSENMRLVCFTALVVLLECAPLAPTDPFVVHLHGFLHSQLWPYATTIMDTATVLKEWQLTDTDDVQLVSKALAIRHPTISPLVEQLWSASFAALIATGIILAFVACVFCDPWHQGYVITGTGLIVLGYHCLSKVLREQHARTALTCALGARCTALMEGPVTLVPPLSPVPVTDSVLDEPAIRVALETMSPRNDDVLPAATSLPLMTVPEDGAVPTMAEFMDRMKPAEMLSTLTRLHTLIHEAPEDDVSDDTRAKVANSLALLEAMQSQGTEMDA